MSLLVQEQALEVARCSPYAERIMPLIGNPRAHSRTHSNCHGTLAYSLGLYIAPLPRFLPSSDMEKILSRTLNEDPLNPQKHEPSNLVAFSVQPRLMRGLRHTVLLLGSTEEPTFQEFIFHQPDTDYPFELTTLEEYKDTGPRWHPTYHRITQEQITPELIKTLSIRGKEVFMSPNS